MLAACGYRGILHGYLHRDIPVLGLARHSAGNVTWPGGVKFENRNLIGAHVRLLSSMALVLAAAGSVAADEVAIGQLNLTNLNSTGYQAVTFSDFTGLDSGCQNGLGTFQVCNGLTITNWALTIAFTNQAPGNASPSYGLFTSPLVETWTGSADDIGPYDPSVNNGYGFTGGLSGTWEIPLNFGNPDEPPCPAAGSSGPSCDYQITQVQFSGTISAVDTPFELGLSAANGGNFDTSDPSSYTIFTPVSTFNAVWNVPQDDYYSPTLTDPLYFGDPSGFNVMVSDQASPSTVPEPSGFILTGTIFAVFFWKRGAIRSVVRSGSDSAVL